MRMDASRNASQSRHAKQRRQARLQHERQSPDSHHAEGSHRQGRQKVRRLRVLSVEAPAQHNPGRTHRIERDQETNGREGYNRIYECNNERILLTGIGLNGFMVSTRPLRSRKAQ